MLEALVTGMRLPRASPGGTLRQGQQHGECQPVWLPGFTIWLFSCAILVHQHMVK